MSWFTRLLGIERRKVTKPEPFKPGAVVLGRDKKDVGSAVNTEGAARADHGNIETDEKGNRRVFLGGPGPKKE